MEAKMRLYDILKIKELTLAQKNILLKICRLSKKGQCYISNERIADELGIHPITVSKAISKLKKLGCFEEISFNGRVRNIKVSDKLLQNPIEFIKQNAKTELANNLGSVSNSLRQTKPKAKADLAESLIYTYNNKPENNLRITGNKQWVETTAENLITVAEKIQADKQTADKISDKINTEKKEKEKKSAAKKEKEEIRLIYPFPEHPAFMAKWGEWLVYRAERHLTNSLRHKQIMLKHLDTLSDHCAETCIEIMQQSITQGWQGLFAVKNQKINGEKTKYNFDRLVRAAAANHSGAGSFHA